MWIKGKVINDKAGDGLITVQVLNSRWKMVIAKNTNQRLVDAEKGIKEFEIEVKE